MIVLTPQILVNALDAGEAHFSQIALLVSATGAAQHVQHGHGVHSGQGKLDGCTCNKQHLAAAQAPSRAHQ